MKFTYRYHSIELLVVGIEYPVFPAKPGERAITFWQVTIDEMKSTIKKGSKKEIIDKVKLYIRQIDGDEAFEEGVDDEFDGDIDDNFYHDEDF